MLKKQKGITLIALIITIIVMLILVGVTISVALNGGIFSKGEKASYQTNASTIKEQLALKKAEIIAGDNGKQPETYTIKISDLAIPEKMIKEFETKLIISSDAELYYDAAVVTEKEEQDWLKEIGITEYIGGPIPPKEPTEKISFYGSYTYYNAGESMILQLMEPDEEGKIVATLMGENGICTYDSDNRTGTLLFETMDAEFAFSRKDILDEDGNIINIACIISAGESEEEYMIFLKNGGIGTIPTQFLDKSYVWNKGGEKETIVTFDSIKVGDLEYGIINIGSYRIGDCYYIDGELYWLYDKGVEKTTVSPNYEKIICGGSEFELVKE